MLIREIGIGALLVMTGCASVGSNVALIEARQMREKAAVSRAPEMAPGSMREAERILADAEDESDAHLAFLAASKFETAMAEARRKDAMLREETALRRVFTEQARLRRSNQGQIAEIQKDRTAVQSLLDSTQAELDAVKLRLDAETSAGGSAAEQLRQEASALEEQLRVLTAKRAALEQALAARG